MSIPSFTIDVLSKGLQFPVISLLILTYYEAYKTLGRDWYYWMFLAWISNGVYVFFNLTQTYSNFSDSSVLGLETWSILGFPAAGILPNYLDALTFSFFMVGAKRKDIFQNFGFNHAGIILLGLSIYTLPYLGGTIGLSHGLALFLMGLFNAVSIYLVIRRIQSTFKSQTVHYIDKESRQSLRILVIGFSLFGCVQLLYPFSSFAYVTNSVFVVTAIAKALICLGLYKQFISLARRSVSMSLYRRVLGMTLHETTPLLTNIEAVLDRAVLSKLRKSTPISPGISRRMIASYLEYASAELARVNAINAASDEILRTDAIQSTEQPVALKINRDNLDMVSVTTILEKAVLLSKDRFGKNIISVKTDYSRNATVIIEATHLYQIARNIFNNCIEAGQKNQRIVLHISVKSMEIDEILEAYDWTKKKFKRYVVIEIEDNGPGIDSNHLDTIFNMGKSSKGAHRGYGLGISRGIAQLYFGDLFVHSPPNPSKLNKLFHQQQRIEGGTKFTLIIPHSEQE